MKRFLHVPVLIITALAGAVALAPAATADAYDDVCPVR